MVRVSLLVCVPLFFRSGLETGVSVVYFPTLLSLSVASSHSVVLTSFCPFRSEFPLVVCVYVSQTGFGNGYIKASGGEAACFGACDSSYMWQVQCRWDWLWKQSNRKFKDDHSSWIRQTGLNRRRLRRPRLSLCAGQSKPHTALWSLASEALRLSAVELTTGTTDCMCVCFYQSALL